MKIIFDSKEQKDRWLHFLSDGCPVSWLCGGRDSCPKERISREACKMCWECAVEMEVKNEDVNRTN